MPKDRRSSRYKCLLWIAGLVLMQFHLDVFACAIQFTSPAKGITVSSQTVSVSGTASGFANTGSVGNAVATVNGATFFSYSGTFTTIINFLGSGSATATLQPGRNVLQVTGSVSGCSASDSMIIYYSPPAPVAQKNGGVPKDPNCTNPVNGATGNKFQEEVDYEEAGPLPLEFRRYYNSAYTESRSLGKGWRSNFDSQLSIVGSTAYIVRPDGEAFRFTNSGGTWTSDGDINDKFSAATVNGVSQWQFIRGEDNVAEYYDTAGRLVTIVHPTGRKLSLTYDGLGRLQAVTDPYQGRALQFTFDAKGQIATLIDPAGNVFTYQYSDNVHLTAVLYPATSGTPQRRYTYNESAYTSGANLPDALTGITDENGIRFATYTFDAQGRGIATEHAAGDHRYTLAYNADGTTTVTDPLGAARTSSYQTILNVKRKTSQNQPPGAGCSAASSSISYNNTNGNITSRTDFNGNTTTYAYDSGGRNLEVTRVEAAGTAIARTTNTTWHAYWRLPIKIAAPLKLTTYVYNGDTYNGSVVSCAPASATVPAGSSTRPIGVLCQKIEQATTDANGSAGFSATTTGSPRTWTYTYNQNGQLLTANGPRTDVADTTTFIYHPDTTATHTLGDLASVTDALGHVTQITAYDKNGRPLAVLDPNGVTLTFTYTPRGWLQTSSVAGNGATLTTTYDYDGVGQLLSVTRPDGSKTSYGYDDAHRLTSVTDLKGNQIKFTLDGLGNITRTDWLNPDGSSAKRQAGDYDALGRLQHAIATRNGVDNTTNLGYDAQGNLKTVTDPKGKTTSTSYDALDRPTQITDALAGLTTLAYDARDQLTQFKAPNNATTSFTVDGLGNVKQEVSADRGTLNATYDEAGNLLTLSDARGVVETHTWDALNRPLTVSYPTTGETIAYTWDAAPGCTNGIGRLCQVSDNGGSTAFAYDVRGNRVSETRTEGGVTLPTLQYGWDDGDRLTTEITATGKLLTSQRDTDGRIQQLSTALGGSQVNLLSSVQQDAAGNVTAQTFGNGVKETKTFNTDGTPAAQTETVPQTSGGSSDSDVPTLPEWGAILLGSLLLLIGYRQQGRSSPRGGRFFSLLTLGFTVLLLQSLGQPQAFADEALTYDANGNVQTRTLPGGTTTYGYDELNRLTSEAGPAKTQSLTYDPNDNRTSDGTGTKTYTANTDRIVTENGQSFTLDGAGNITQARGLSFTWNQAVGQIRTVSQGGTLLATYYYDYKGRRTRKVTTAAAPQGAGTVIYTYDLYDRLKGELDGAGHPLRTYVWREDTPVSIIVQGATETALYLEVDHLNTPIAARDQTGKLVWAWESDAFGSTLPNEDPGSTGNKVTINLRFPGQYFDRESGLHYNYRRYYDPKLGRYLSPDPIGLAGGGNLYGYAGGNPLRNSDPFGLSPEDVKKLIAYSKKITDEMTNQGARTDPGWWNNACYYGELFGLCKHEYSGCREQSSYLRNSLNEAIKNKTLTLDDKWTIEQTMTPSLSVVHYRLEATSGNSDDPLLILDPWNNKFEAKKK